jgi:hypothetical protein
MEARLFRVVGVTAILLVSMGAQFATPNFVIQTDSPPLAEHFGRLAEQLRQDLALDWTGHAIGNWSRPCPVTVQVGEHLGAGGSTTFVFDRGEVYGWKMNIQGSAQRIADSVLPHEILHMVLATHFRQPLPRWADEGAATTVEHPSEQVKHRRKLIEFLQNGRGIAFNQLFAMMDYPQNDPMPLYAHGYSLADYLIQHGGRRKYVAFVGEGLKDDRWAEAIERLYGKRGLGDLQNQWVAWVAQGSPTLSTAPGQPQDGPRRTTPVLLAQTPAPPAPRGTAGTWIASAARLPRPEPNLVYRDAVAQQNAPDDRPLEPIRRTTTPLTERDGLAGVSGNAAGRAPARFSQDPPVGLAATQTAETVAPVPAVLTRPQSIEPSRQIILDQIGRP